MPLAVRDAPGVPRSLPGAVVEQLRDVAAEQEHERPFEEERDAGTVDVAVLLEEDAHSSPFAVAVVGAEEEHCTEAPLQLRQVHDAQEVVEA